VEGGGPVRIPPVGSLADLLADSDGLPVDRVERLLPSKGRVSLIAEERIDTAAIVVELVRCLADGTPFLGRTVARPAGRIVVLDHETTTRESRDRWVRGGPFDSERVGVMPLWHYVTGFKITDPKCRESWAEKLRSLQCEVLIVDSIRPILDILDLYKNEDVGRFLQALDSLQLEAGISEMVIVNNERRVSRVEEWPDGVWSITRTGDVRKFGASYFRDADGRSFGMDPSRLATDPQTGRLSLLRLSNPA